MKLPREVEQRAVRDSLLSAQRMADFDRESAAKKAGLRWWHDFTIPATLIGLSLAMIVVIGVFLYWLISGLASLIS